MNAAVMHRAISHWKAARWWRIHMRESRSKKECWEYSLNLQILCLHMLKNNWSYVNRGEESDYQIMKRMNK